MSLASLVVRYILCRAMSVLILVFKLGDMGVVVEFLLVYQVSLYFWAGVLVWHPSRPFVFVLFSFPRCVWWWLLCGPVCGSLYGTLFVGDHWSRIFSFPIIGKHDWVGFGPYALRHWLALWCLWVFIHWVWIHSEFWILCFFSPFIFLFLRAVWCASCC